MLLWITGYYSFFSKYIFYYTLGSGVHVQNIQDCCIGTYMAVWFVASIPQSPISGISLHVIPPQPPYPPLSLPYSPLNRTQYVMLPSLCPWCVLIVQHPPMNENMRCLFFWPCVSLLRIMVSRFIHVPTKNTNSSLFIPAYYSMVYMCHIFLFQSIIDGHLGWFQIFAIVNSASMNICLHVAL